MVCTVGSRTGGLMGKVGMLRERQSMAEVVLPCVVRQGLKQR